MRLSADALVPPNTTRFLDAGTAAATEEGDGNRDDQYRGDWDHGGRGDDDSDHNDRGGGGGWLAATIMLMLRQRQESQRRTKMINVVALNIALWFGAATWATQATMADRYAWASCAQKNVLVLGTVASGTRAMGNAAREWKMATYQALHRLPGGKHHFREMATSDWASPLTKTT